MLRAIIVLLLLANAAFYAWTQNWLSAVGFAHPSSVSDTSPQPAKVEPINADKLQLISNEKLEQARQRQDGLSQRPADASSATAPEASGESSSATPAVESELAVQAATPTTPAAPEPRPAVCKAIGPFSPEQMQPIRAVLKNWPDRSWAEGASKQTGRWMVFWGQFDDDLVFAAKKSELDRKNLEYAPLRNGTQGRGFSLGRFSTEVSANQELRRLSQQGLNGLKVVQEREEVFAHIIEFPDFESIRPQYGSQLANLLQGRTLKNCE